MSESPQPSTLGLYWFAGSLVSGAAGLALGFLAILGPGLGASGSGCGSGCQSTSETFASFGMLAMGGAFVSAVVSMKETWSNRVQSSSSAADTVITGMNLLVMLVSGACLAFLASLY